jgi:EAL domain-containing protein (putative c-di-GMP-specific phosphodiesterase class I)
VPRLLDIAINGSDSTHLDAVLDACADAVLVVDDEGVVRFASSGAIRMAGLVYGDTVYDVLPRVDPRSVAIAQQMAAGLRESTDGSRRGPITVIFRDQDARSRTLAVIVRNLESDRDIRGVLVTAWDVTDAEHRQPGRRADPHGLGADLRRALATDDLELMYQPVVHLPSGDVVSAESLLRWRHPTHGAIAPPEIVRVADEQGLLQELTCFTLAAATQVASHWPTHQDGCGMTVAVNLSARQLAYPHIVEIVAGALGEAGLPQEQLMIEVTETAVIEGTSAVTALKELQEQGVRCAIDDFGTGYSTLALLRELPISAVKVDKQFVQNLGSSERDTAIVTSVLGLAAGLGLQCIAEGVEDVQVLEMLRRLGCELAQGYLWSPAVPAERFCETLAQIEQRSRNRPHKRDEFAAIDTGLVNRVLALRQAGASATSIAAALNSEGRHTHSGRGWRATSVERLLRKLNVAG